MKIIFAQGNPGSKYDKTRHNIGFYLIDRFAEKQSASWQEKSKFNAMIAELNIDDEKILLIKPNTFYNDTGLCIRKLIDFYTLDTTQDLLVIHDDLSLPISTIRVREKGSDAGNNGIKSISQHIGEDYHRLRVGIWNELRDQMDDASFVLSRMNKEEHDNLEQKIYPLVEEKIKNFISGNIDITSHKI